jgi:hypothetical protein
MIARPFDKQLDKAQFTEWCKAHKMPVDENTMMAYLPEQGGFIVDGFGCVFVYETKSRMAYVDMMMTNPNAPFDKRREAGRLLIDAIMAFAREHNIHLYSWATSNKAIDHYAKYAGSFQIDQKPHQLWYWINPAFEA